MVRDRELMKILSRIDKLNFEELSVSELMAFKSMILKAEEKCKWLCSSTKAGNLMRKLDREMNKRIREYNYWGMAA